MRDLLIIPLIFILLVPLKAQQLPIPIQFISKENNSFIFLRNGETLEGKIFRTQSLEGYFNGLEVRTNEGDVHALIAADIRCMYVPSKNSYLPNGIVNKHYWDSEYKNYFIDENIINKGYAFIETIEMDLINEEGRVFIQLLNPKSVERIKIYENPLINAPLSTMDAHRSSRSQTDSYYIKKKRSAMQLIEKTDYRSSFFSLWGGCNNVVDKYPVVMWQDLISHIEDYINCPPQ